MPKIKFNSPVLGEDAKEVYDAYGEMGNMFMDILEKSPDDKAVISRMLAYLNMLVSNVPADKEDKAD